MAISDPVAAFTAGSNVEAQFVCGLLHDAGLAAEVMADESLAGVWVGGTMAGIHKPQVWIERADFAVAQKIVADYERRTAGRRAAGQAASPGPPIEVICEQCGKRSEFPAAQLGTVQDCPHCSAYVDVGDDAGIEDWGEAEEGN